MTNLHLIINIAIIFILIIYIFSTLYLTRIIYHIFKEKECGWAKIFKNLNLAILLMSLESVFFIEFIIDSSIFEIICFCFIYVLAMALLFFNSLILYNSWHKLTKISHKKTIFFR